MTLGLLGLLSAARSLQPPMAHHPLPRANGGGGSMSVTSPRHSEEPCQGVSRKVSYSPSFCVLRPSARLQGRWAWPEPPGMCPAVSSWIESPCHPMRCGHQSQGDPWSRGRGLEEAAPQLERGEGLPLLSPGAAGIYNHGSAVGAPWGGGGQSPGDNRTWEVTAGGMF